MVVTQAAANGGDTGRIQEAFIMAKSLKSFIKVKHNKEEHTGIHQQDHHTWLEMFLLARSKGNVPLVDFFFSYKNSSLQDSMNMSMTYCVNEHEYCKTWLCTMQNIICMLSLCEKCFTNNVHCHYCHTTGQGLNGWGAPITNQDNPLCMKYQQGDPHNLF